MERKLIPPKLQDNATVALIAPARFIETQQLDEFSLFCENNKWNLIVDKQIFQQHHQFAGTEIEREKAFFDAWYNPEVSAIFCARGGYGTQRWLQLAQLQSKYPKWLIGYSDITYLHNYLNKKSIVSLHGPMAINLSADMQNMSTKENWSRLVDALKTGRVSIDLGEKEIVNKKNFNGELIGGNLSILYAIAAGNDLPNFKDKVLFIEDLDEYLYHIDRMLLALKCRGVFAEIGALLVGEFLSMKDNAIPFGQTVKEMILHYTKEYKIPIVFDFPAGHGDKNFCFMHGFNCNFDGTIFSQKI